LGKRTEKIADAEDVRQHAGNHDAAITAVQSKYLGVYVTEKFVGKYRGSGWNATTDNWFTSYPSCKV